MTTHAGLPIAVSFAGHDHGLVNDMVGALIDMALTELGASVDLLETAYLAVGEIVDAVAASGRVQTVELHDRGTTPRLRIYHSARAVTFDAGSRAIAEAAFPEIRAGDGFIELLPSGSSRGVEQQAGGDG